MDSQNWGQFRLAQNSLVWWKIWNTLRVIWSTRHRNPVKRGLVEQPDQWKWSSFRAYYNREHGVVRVNFQEWPLEIRARPVEKFTDDDGTQRPLIRKVRE